MSKSFRNELEGQGFATIDYLPYVKLAFEGMMKEWQMFCALPLAIKSRFVYGGEYGSGYEYKNTIGTTLDVKENFHLLLSDIARIRNFCTSFDVDQRFVYSAENLLQTIQGTILGFARVIEREYGLDGLEDELFESHDKWVLRLLHYPHGSEAGQVIAAPHVDKLGITMYLGETTSGVQYFSKDRKWVSMPVLTGQTIITPNMQMQYKTRGELKALCHRVVANEESGRVGRYSIVCFADLFKTPQYNKEKFGRLQEMAVGFNYDLPHEQFAKFFI